MACIAALPGVGVWAKAEVPNQHASIGGKGALKTKRINETPFRLVKVYLMTVNSVVGVFRDLLTWRHS